MTQLYSSFCFFIIFALNRLIKRSLLFYYYSLRKERAHVLGHFQYLSNLISNQHPKTCIFIAFDFFAKIFLLGLTHIFKNISSCLSYLYWIVKILWNQADGLPKEL